MTDNYDNHREHKRVDVQLRTVYHDQIDADQSDSLMSNLSMGGCFIRSSRVLSPGARMKLRFKLEDEGVVDAVGIVRWAQGPREGEEEGGMGVQFESVEGDGLVLLKRFLERKIAESLFL